MKKVYIMPETKAYQIESTNVICGSGDNNPSLPSGSSGQPPTPSSGGVIPTDSKGIFVDEDDCDVEW